MKKKQFLALALSAVMAGGMLAGCGSSNGSSNGSSSSSKSDAKDEVVTLKWIQVGNGMPKVEAHHGQSTAVYRIRNDRKRRFL